VSVGLVERSQNFSNALGDAKMSIKHTVLMLNDGITFPQLKGEVEELQNILKSIGLLDDDHESSAADGLFGRKTDAAVREFQGRRMLEVDGIVGRLTWAALLNVNSDQIELLPRPGVTFEGIFSTTYPAGQFQNEINEITSRVYKPLIEDAARDFGFQPSLIAGLGSRESNWGLILSPPGSTGKGDRGHGHGLMQIDDGTFRTWIATGKWKDAKENIRKGCEILADNRRFFEGMLGASGSLLVRATVAAYNAGPGNVKSAIRNGRDVDSVTTGRDYSKDVLNRAGWYQKFAGWR
jgi:soluble lytic murein transglycosylase-like protein